MSITGDTARMGCLLVAGLLVPWAAKAQVLEPATAAQLCATAAVSAVCPVSCASACREPSFLADNVEYCIATGVLTPDNPTAQGEDGAACPELLGLTDATPDATESTAAGEDDCDALASLSERRRCALAKITPACSTSVTDLEGRARLLVGEISRELEAFGELLQRDWTAVDNRTELCRFTLEDLDRQYGLTQENPEILRALQTRATGIQSCQTDWENWVRDNAGTRSSDRLIDQASRDAEEQLGPLKEQIGELSVSVDKLENAAATIVEIVDVHIIFCDPGGTTPAGE